MPNLRASIDLPSTVHSVPLARRLTIDLLRVWRAPQDRDDVALLVTELVSNVVDHVGGGAELTLEVELAEAMLRIAVADGSTVQPVVREPGRENPRGRGLWLVQAIADRWGSNAHRRGKQVWFELSAPG